MKAGKGQSNCQSGLNNGKQNVKKGPIKKWTHNDKQNIHKGSILCILRLPGSQNIVEYNFKVTQKSKENEQIARNFDGNGESERSKSPSAVAF